MARESKGFALSARCEFRPRPPLTPLIHSAYCFHMESERSTSPSDAPLVPSIPDAAEQLRRADELREQAEHSGPSRAYAILTLWSALLISSYIFVCVLSMSADHDTSGPTTLSVLMPLMLLPVLSFNLLIRGARERFSVRTVASRPQIVGYALLVAAFLVVSVMSVMGASYPWWLSILMGLASLWPLARTPLKQLRAARQSQSQSRQASAERWRTTPLSTSSRIITAGYGVVMGIAVALIPHMAFSYLALFALFALLLLSSQGAQKMSLTRVGYEWGPAHWIAFGITTVIIFTLIPLHTFTSFITAPVALTFGALIALDMVGAALIPLRYRTR